MSFTHQSLRAAFGRRAGRRCPRSSAGWPPRSMPLMPTSTVLHHSRMLALLDVRCSAPPRATSDLEEEQCFSVVLPRRGVYVQHRPGSQIVVDPTIVLFLSDRQVHRTSHPTAQGDRNTVIAFRHGTAEPFVTEEGSFPVFSLSTGTSIHLGHRAMLSAVQSGSTTALEVDEWAVGLTADLLLSSRAAPPRTKQHRQVVEDAREYLAVHFSGDTDLLGLARHVGSSPHHLSRSFRMATGRTISGYRTELRVRHVLDLLADGVDDLSRLAIEAGFYDHSHMTRSIRRHTGETPSRLRSILT